MNKHWLISAAALTLVNVTGSFAADSTQTPPPAPAGSPAPAPHHEWTLEEARKHAHERADKLDKMTPEEWAAEQQKHEEWWHSLTPEQKQSLKQAHGLEHKQDGAPAAPPPAH